MMISNKFILFLFICGSIHLIAGKNDTNVKNDTIDSNDTNSKDYFDKEKYCPCPLAELRKKRGSIIHGALGGLKDLPQDQMKFLAEIYSVTDQLDKKTGTDIRDDKLFLSLKCTGTIISPRFVLTATYCFDKIQGFDEKTKTKIKGMVIAGHGKEDKRFCDDNYVKFAEHFHKIIKNMDPHPSVEYPMGLIELEEEGFIFGEETDIYPACFSRYMLSYRPQKKLRYHVGFGKRTPHPSTTYEVGRFKKSIKTFKKVGRLTRGIATETEYEIIIIGDWDPTKPKIFPVYTDDKHPFCTEYRRLHQNHLGYPLHCTFSKRASTCKGDIGGPLMQWWESKYYVVVGVLYDQVNTDERSNIVCNNETINLNIPINERHNGKQFVLDRLFNLTNSYICTTKNYYKEGERIRENEPPYIEPVLEQVVSSDESSFGNIWVTFILIGLVFTLTILLTHTILKKEKMQKSMDNKIKLQNQSRRKLVENQEKLRSLNVI